MSKENVCQAALNTKLPLPKFHDGDHDGGVHYDADDDPDEEFLPAPRLLVFKSACEITPPTEAPSKAAAFDVTAAPAAPPAPGAEAAAQEPVGARSNPRAQSYATKAQTLAQLLENASGASADASAAALAPDTHDAPPLPPIVGEPPARRAPPPAGAAKRPAAAAPAKKQQPPAKTQRKAQGTSTRPPASRWAQVRRPDGADLAMRTEADDDAPFHSDQFGIYHDECVAIVNEKISKNGTKYYEAVKGQLRGWVKAIYVFFKEVDAEYEVEKVVRHRTARKKVTFEIKWKGFKDTTWEPPEHIKHLREYRDYCTANGLEVFALSDDSSDDDDEEDKEDDDGDEEDSE